MSARETALKIIYDIEFNGAYSNMALKKSIPKDMEKREKALVTALVYGVIDKKLTLDYVISQFSKLRINKLSKYILIILRMGLYQLMFMDKIPNSAAVNESVRLAKKYGHGASAGFVNGVLRTASRSEIEYPSDGNEFLSVRYSFPLQLCEKWVKDFGYGFAEELLKSFEETPKLYLRPNRLKTTAEELLSKLGRGGRVVGDMIVTDEGFDVSDDELFRRGYYTVQDPAAYGAARTLAPREGDTVIDVCAAPGGKTTAMAEMMNDTGRIYAFDIYPHKTELINKNAERLGITIIETAIKNGCEFDERFSEIADRILCDVPCSGLGIVRRKPEIKWRAAANTLPETQLEILSNAARYLKIGGEIVYSTCTVERGENEGVTDAFLNGNKNFSKLCEKTFYPHIDGTDGFYICKMKRVK